MRIFFAAFTMATSAFSQSDFLPALIIEPITIEDPSKFAALMASTNSVMRERHETPLYLRAYVMPSMTGLEQLGFTLSPSASIAGLMAAREAFLTDPTLEETREKLRTLSSAGPASYLKAIRFDGTHNPGWLCNMLVCTTDETALLERVEELAPYLLSPDQTPIFINVFRFVSGPGPETHLISINAASGPDLGSKLDSLLNQSDPIVDSSTLFISRTIYRELAP